MRITREREERRGLAWPQPNDLRSVSNLGILLENLHVHTLGPPLTRITRQKVNPWNEESSSPADSFKLNARQTRRTEQACGLFRHRDEGRNRRRWIPEQITRLVDGHVRA